MIKVIKECNEILDFAWELCQDNTKVSYPRDDTKESLKYKIERAINSTTRRAIGYYNDNKLLGVCVYDWIEEDKYTQTEVLLIKDNYNIAVDEMMNYIKGHLDGYDIYVGITADNKEAIHYFEEREISCIDNSLDTRLFKENFKLQDIKREITKLDWEDFQEYSKFHDKYAGDIYWNSEHLREAFKNFKILIYRDNKEIMGSIFTKKIHRSEAEIVGLFMDESAKGKGIEGDLIGITTKSLYEEYRDMNEIVYFIQEGSKDELNYALNYGFKIKDNYRCYKGKLG